MTPSNSMAPRINFLDRAIATVAPVWGLQRAAARDRLTLFGYDAANPDGARGYNGGIGKNGSSETPRMAMDRLKMMWEARDLERNMPIIRCALATSARAETTRGVSGEPRCRFSATVIEFTSLKC